MSDGLPAWLRAPQSFDPPRGRNRSVDKSILAIGGVLAQFRLDDGRPAVWTPSAPVALVFALGCILLTSLSRNYAFVLVMLAFVLLRAMLLPAAALRRVAAVACGAAVLSFVLMLPAILLGQPQSALLIATKALVSTGIALSTALSLPYNDLTAALRAFRVPAVFVMTVDLALKNIVRLGRVALEALTALRLRSVGARRGTADALGGVAGTVFLKSNEAAAATFDAMTCRGFDGSYETARRRWLKPADAAWAVLGAVIAVAFAYLQAAV